MLKKMRIDKIPTKLVSCFGGSLEAFFHPCFESWEHVGHFVQILCFAFLGGVILDVAKWPYLSLVAQDSLYQTKRLTWPLRNRRGIQYSNSCPGASPSSSIHTAAVLIESIWAMGIVFGRGSCLETCNVSNMLNRLTRPVTLSTAPDSEQIMKTGLGMNR